VPGADLYRIFGFSGRDVLAAPLNSRKLRMAAVQCIPVTGRIGRWSRFGLGGATWLGVDSLFGERSKDPVRRFGYVDWTGLVRRLQAVLAREDVELVVTQPPQVSRKRFYVHVLSKAGTRLAFAKVSADEDNDLKLQREAEVLRRIGRSEPLTYRVPSVLDASEVGGRCLLVLEPIPVRAAPIAARWSSLVDGIQREVAGPSIMTTRREDLSWWAAFQDEASQVSGLASRITESGEPWEVTAAHGDLTNWNLYQVDGARWLFDWESYSPDAPILADRIRFFIGVHTRELEANPRKVCDRVRSHFGSLGHGEDCLVRALAFLHTRGVHGATLLAQHWKFAARRAT